MNKSKNKSNLNVVILLGSLKYVKYYSSFLKEHDSNARLLVVDVLEARDFSQHENIIYLKVTKNNASKTIISYCKIKKLQVIGVLNRKDIFESLYGQLSELFNVHGPSVLEVENFSDKAKLHKLMVKNNLASYRPMSIITTIDKASFYFDQFEFPIIIKNNLGSKSLGVIKIKNHHEFEKLKEILIRNMINPKMDLILVEEFLNGEQVAPAMYVDKRGKVKIIAFVDIITAREVGQNHMQLIYRTTPSFHKKYTLKKIERIMQILVDAISLKSTMLHPEFFVIDDRVYLIEINVRIAGFRDDLLKNAFGLDLAKLSWQLAMGLPILEKKTISESSTVCEVWSEKSGIIKEILVPQNEYLVSLKYGLNPGDNYIAPPLAQKRLALFYVKSPTDSLLIAKEIRNKTIIKFK